MCHTTSGKIYKGLVKNRINLHISLLNYCYHDQIDNNIKKDPWLVWHQLKDIANGLKISVFESIFSPFGTFPPEGKDSSILKGVYTDLDLHRLFGWNRRKILRGYNETVEDNIITGLKYNFLHIFPLKESKKNPAHIIKISYGREEYQRYNIIDINNFKSPVSYNQPVTLPVNKEFYIVALPFLLTPQVFDYIKTILANPDYSKHYQVFRVSTRQSDLQKYDKRNRGKEKHKNSTWFLPVFNPFYVALVMSKALKRCIELSELQNPASPMISTDFYLRQYSGFKNKNKIKLMKNKSMYLSIMMSLSEHDSNVKKIIDNKKLKKIYEFHNRWLIQGARLFEVLSHLLDSTLFIQLEETATTFELESKENAKYWVKLFITLAPVLQSHDKGCAILARRFSEIKKTKQTSPLSIYCQAVFLNTKSSKVAQLKSSLWNVEPWIGKTLDSITTFFNGYVYYKITNLDSAKFKKGDLQKINKELENAAESFKNNLPTSKPKLVLGISKGFQRTLSLAKKLSDISEGKINAGNAVDTLNTIADYYSKFDRNVYTRLYARAIIFKFAAVLLSAINEGYNAYKLLQRSDYNALIGSGLIVASGVTELCWVIATQSLLEGPVGWIVGGIALVGGVILMVAIDSDFETFSHRCFFSKNRKDKKLNTFIGSYKEWGTLKLKDIHFQLHSLLTIFYKIEDTEFKTYSNGFKLSCFFNCKPENAAISAHIEFDGPGSSKPWIKIKVRKIGHKFPIVYNKRSSDAPIIYTGKCHLSQDKQKGKWKLEITYEVINWKMLNNEFDDGWVKIYPFGMKEFDCPPGIKARRINAAFYEFNIIKIK